MPPRPTGTDGRDHSYREVIAERYKRMANFKDSIEKLMFLHIAFLCVKLGWHFAVQSLDGILMPRHALGMAVGEVALLLVYSMAKLGNVKESLTLLKVFNMVQSLITASEVLSGWAYHNGTNTGGVPTYENSEAMAKFIVAKYPGYNPGTVLSSMKGFEMFLDLTLAAFLVMGTFVSHKMIVEKMQMKKERESVRTDRKDAQKGGSDDDGDDEGAPAAVPLREEKAKAVRAASRSDALRRRA
ncbi:hypothetical protein COO60DRAFT_1505809 [Scenedesmus sp. NREL 46B-D3]|nr:hypothetical protein COO60DRAFT_1505809 [Scenedesmus sp. NREL 46B-D3]